MKKRLNGLVTVLVCLFAVCLAGCNSGKTGCGMCDTMATKCEWSQDSLEYCQRTCQQEQEYPPKCEGLYDTAMSCFNDEASWSCTSSRGLVGCNSELESFRECRIGRWQAIPDLPGADRRLVQVSSQPQILYAATGRYNSGRGFYKSEDGGASWSRVGGSLPQDITALAVSRDDPALLYAGLLSVIYRSSDGGKEWTAVSQRLSEVRDVLKLQLATPDGQTLYAVLEEDGFFRSTDQGKTWTQSNSGLPVQSYDSFEVMDTQTFATSPADAQTIFLGTGRSHIANGANGVFKSVNGGASWSAANKGMLDIAITTLVALDTNTVFAASDGISGAAGNTQVFFSQDGAETWTGILGEETDSGYGVVDLIVNPDNVEDVYLLMSNLEVLHRGSGGSWTTLVQMPEDQQMFMADADNCRLVGIFSTPLVLVVSTSEGLWRFVGD